MANHSSPPSFSTGRRWAFAFNVVLAVAAVLAIGAMLNYLAARHYQRFDLSARRDKQLSPQTLRLLRTLTNDVKVTVFFVAHDSDEHGEEELYRLTTSLLREYTLANPRISVKTVDPSRHPTEAELVLAGYKLTGLKDKNFILFDCEGRTKVIYQGELSDYDVGAVLSGQAKEFKRKSFKGEMLFTTAIFNLANPRQFKVCFLTGHGEHDPERIDHPHGYAKFAAILREKSNARVEKLTLLGTNDVPPDCQLLVIAGARLPLADVELDKINRYLKQGGRLFALMGNLVYAGTAKTGLEKLLATWGIGVADDIVFDLPNSPTHSDLDLFTAQMSSEHPIMKALMSGDEDLRLRLVMPRAIGQSTATANNPDAPKVTVLAATGKDATEVTEIRDGTPYHNPYSDRTGVFPLVATAEQGAVKGVTPERGSMRLLVVGDSLCLDNELIDNAPANHLFAGLAVDWLLDRPQILLEGLLPRPLKEYRLLLTERESRNLLWIFLAGMPGAVLLLGGLVWLRRRK